MSNVPLPSNDLLQSLDLLTWQDKQQSPTEKNPVKNTGELTCSSIVPLSLTLGTKSTGKMQESTATKNSLRQSQMTTHQGTSNIWMGYDTSLSEGERMDTLWPSSTANESETTLKEILLDGKQKGWRPTWQLMSGTPVTEMDQGTIGYTTYLSLQDSYGDTRKLSDNMMSDMSSEIMKTNLYSPVTWTMSSNIGATSEPVNGHMMHNKMSTNSWIEHMEKDGKTITSKHYEKEVESEPHHRHQNQLHLRTDLHHQPDQDRLWKKSDQVSNQNPNQIQVSTVDLCHNSKPQKSSISSTLNRTHQKQAAVTTTMTTITPTMNKASDIAATYPISSETQTNTELPCPEFLDLWNEIMKNMSTGTDLLALWEEEVRKRDQETTEMELTDISPGKSTNQKMELPLISSTTMGPITSATATEQSNIMAEASAVSSSANSQCGLEELMMDNGSMTSGGQEGSSYQAPESQHIPSMKSMTKRKIEMMDATHLTYTRHMNRIAPKKKLTGAEKMKKHREKRRKVIDREEDWRKLWEDVKEEMELELKGGGTINKGLYYTIGLVIENYPKGKKELSQYRIKIAKRIYTMYRNSDEIDDEIGIYKISREKERELRKLARRQWVSKILGGRSCYDESV